jgi:hypothetical protein
MSKIIWLRAESKTGEARSALTPGQCGELIKSGFEVIVERSSQRVFKNEEFAKHMCRLVDTNSWPGAPTQAWVLGLKELPEDTTPLSHRHIYFAHAYKSQYGWKHLLQRFVDGGGRLFDLEYLLDDSGRRVAAFGYWAGFAGCAVSLKIWAGQQLAKDPVISTLTPYANKDELVDELRDEISAAIEVAGYSPGIIIIGALGRVGEGARQFARELELDITPWDMKETAVGGPFAEILEHDIFINCVLVQKKIPPFITRESLHEQDRKLSVICDVSCDPGDYNPIPLYSEATTFSAPAQKIIDDGKPLHLSAIDHLPSLLPMEASEDFGSQLLPHLLALHDKTNNVWQRALDLFNEKTDELN